MITLAKLAVWQRFDGDVDGWTRTRGRADTSGMSTGDWRTIDDLLLGQKLVAAGEASAEYAAALERRLAEVADGPETLAALRALA